MAKIKSVKQTKEIKFDDVKAWYDEHLDPSVIDFNDQKVYEYVYHGARWGGIFQCVDEHTKVLMHDGSNVEIKDVITGDRVVTYDEIHNCVTSSVVTQTYDQGEKECIELEFDNGKKLVCTVDHPILTHRGWIQAGKLTDQDEVVSFNTLS